MPKTGYCYWNIRRVSQWIWVYVANKVMEMWICLCGLHKNELLGCIRKNHSIYIFVYTVKVVYRLTFVTMLSHAFSHSSPRITILKYQSARRRLVFTTPMWLSSVLFLNLYSIAKIMALYRDGFSSDSTIQYQHYYLNVYFVCVVFDNQPCICVKCWHSHWFHSPI